MKFGLIGERLGHSFSKTIHERLGYEYELREIKPTDFDAFMRRRDFYCINVTIPYKEAVIPYLDWIHEPAKEVGAVNLILHYGGKLYGYNTDIPGMAELFGYANIDPKGKKAAILGSGGTSKTAAAVLKQKGAREILRVSRSGRDGAITYEELYEKHSDVEIIVNTTPVGMYPNIWDCPVDISAFERLEGIIDAVYNPINTTLVKNARARGIKAEGGLYMLVAQAMIASETFLDESGNSHPSLIEKMYNEIRASKENIVLVGMPASGKTTVGKILQKKLDKKFVDTDDIITQRIGMSIRDFFALHGEEKFRDIESQAIKELADKSSLIIATGGGAILREENISALKYNGKIFFIDRPVDKLMPTKSRPLASDKEAIEKRYNERYSIYCGCCDTRIAAEGESAEVAEKILENYR